MGVCVYMCVNVCAHVCTFIRMCDHPFYGLLDWIFEPFIWTISYGLKLPNDLYHLSLICFYIFLLTLISFTNCCLMYS